MNGYGILDALSSALEDKVCAPNPGHLNLCPLHVCNHIQHACSLKGLEVGQGSRDCLHAARSCLFALLKHSDTAELNVLSLFPQESNARQGALLAIESLVDSLGRYFLVHHFRKNTGAHAKARSWQGLRPAKSKHRTVSGMTIDSDLVHQ